MGCVLLVCMQAVGCGGAAVSAGHPERLVHSIPAARQHRKRVPHARRNAAQRRGGEPDSTLNQNHMCAVVWPSSFLGPPIAPMAPLCLKAVVLGSQRSTILMLLLPPPRGVLLLLFLLGGGGDQELFT
jgi:hypothetical protein